MQQAVELVAPGLAKRAIDANDRAVVAMLEAPLPWTSFEVAATDPDCGALGAGPQSVGGDLCWCA